MEIIDTHELAKRLAGGRFFIRTKNGEVRGLAVKTKANPEAPEVLVVGRGVRREGNAERLMACGHAVPLYIKQSSNAWAYRGEFRAISFSNEPAVIEQYRRHRSAKKIAGILFLEEVEGSPAIVPAEEPLPDTETRKAIEEAAVRRVWEYYENKGYEISDRQAEKCGFDLLVTKNKEMLRVEVKGTGGDEPAFWLTRNEKAASVHTYWRLAVVTNALSEKPGEPAIFTGAEMRGAFDLEPYIWRAKLRSLSPAN